jgi:peptide subunit release factor 1 (eRF1)
MVTDTQAALKELTAYPSTEHPFFSVYLDWRPDGNGNRQAVQLLEQELDRIAERLPGSGPDYASFTADRERILNYVNTEAPADAQGLAIFACDAEGVWITLSFQVPVETQIIEDRYPYTFQLARILDDHETFAVVLADSQESRIFVIALNNVEKVAQTEADEEIRRFDAGGWAQMLFQRRTGNVIRAHTKDIADELSRTIKRYAVQHVIIAGNDSIKGIVMDTLPDQIKEQLVDYINLDQHSSMRSIMEVIEPMMHEVERQQEAQAVQDLQDSVATKPGLGVVGIEDTALALSKGQVRTLLMLHDFLAPGRRNPNTGFLYSGLRTEDPYDGSELEPVELREAFTALAVQQSADVQVVEADAYLAEHEGVGAILWYNDAQQPQTVE